MPRHFISGKYLAMPVLFLAFAFSLASACTELKAELKVGDKAPDFSLSGIDGEEVKLSAYAGKKTVVIAFLRAHW